MRMLNINPSTRIVAQPVSSGVSGEPQGYLPQEQRTARGALFGLALGLAGWLLILLALGWSCRRTDAWMDDAAVERQMAVRR